MRLTMRSQRSGQPRKAKTKMETSMTIKRNDVPQRGWKRSNFCAFSAVRGSPASKQKIVLCSAPWYWKTRWMSFMREMPQM